MSGKRAPTQASVEAVLHGLPERSALGGVQRKRVELLTMRLAAHRPAYHLLPAPEDVSSPQLSFLPQRAPSGLTAGRAKKLLKPGA